MSPESLAQDEQDRDDSSSEEGTQSEINNSEPAGSATVAVVAEDPQIDENFLRSLDQEGKDEAKKVRIHSHLRIHSQVAAIWTKILSERLKKETKTDLLEKPRKGNMRLEAPIFNPEVEAVMNDTAKKRDRFLGLDQSLCSATMSVLGSLVSEIILSKDNMKWMDIVQRLNDAGRLQCELMYQLSKARKVFIYPGFKKEARNLLKRTKSDEFLFGDSLGDRLKTAKSAEKSGLSMKVAVPTRKSPFHPSTSENWRGPSARQYYQQTGHKIRIQGYQSQSKIHQNKTQQGRSQGLVRQQSIQVRPSQ